ncbi:dipeptidase [Roseibium algae]|uniref:Dipeptidase n=1 Tax=Roseibium algae TaxID=3123038 RepID=A0ABU8THK5_9HYPH
MTATIPRVPVFDGHNDTLLKRVITKGTDRETDFFERSTLGHIDLPRAQEGGLVGGLFAMFVPSNIRQDFSKPYNPSDTKNYDEIDQSQALDFTLKMAAEAFRLERSSNGRVRICHNVREIRECIDQGIFAISLHIEGAEAIDTDFNALEVLYNAGLRSLGPVWSRKNVFADGAPMRFPSSPDTGPGLTDTGKALVKACNELGILIDLSHLTEKGFWDVAATSNKPLVASHSNAHAICPNARNLTDRQLDAIRETNGLVGLNFHTAFLREDGGYSRQTPLETMVKHVSHLIDRLGEDGVALGSDFDGCMTPTDIPDAAALPALIESFRQAGFGEELIAKIAFKNWLSVLDCTQN